MEYLNIQKYRKLYLFLSLSSLLLVGLTIYASNILLINNSTMGVSTLIYIIPIFFNVFMIGLRIYFFSHFKQQEESSMNNVKIIAGYGFIGILIWLFYYMVTLY